MTVPPSPTAWDRWALPFVAGAAALVVYLLTRTPNLALAHDAAGYLVTILDGPTSDLAHPHHLLYHPTARLWIRLLQSVGLGGDPALAVAGLNSIAGGVCVTFLVALLRHRADVPAPLALAASAAAAVSFGLWFYSACVEVYVLPLALLLATLYVALGAPSPGRAAAVGLLHGLAMLYHQIHVLFGLVVLVVLWRQVGRRGWLRHVAVYVGAGALVVIVGYGIALALAVRPATVADAWHWFTLYAQDGSAVNGPSVGTFAKAAVGFTRSIVGSHFAFAIPAVQALIARAFPDKVLTDETYLVAGLPDRLPLVLVALAVVGAGIGLVLVVRAVRARRAAPASLLGVALWTWFGTYAAFFVFWDPFNVEFWIPQTTALWLLLALGLTRADREHQRAGSGRSAVLLAGLAAVLAVVNGLGTVVPAIDPANDAFARRLHPLSGRLGEGDLLVVGYAHILESYATLDLGATTIGVSETIGEFGLDDGVRRVTGAVRRAQDAGRTVAVSDDVFSPDATTRTVSGELIDVAARRLQAQLPVDGGERVGNDLGAYRILRPTPPRSSSERRHAD